MICPAFFPNQGYIHFGSGIYLNNKIIAQRKFQTYSAPKRHTQQFANKKYARNLKAALSLSWIWLSMTLLHKKIIYLSVMVAGEMTYVVTAQYCVGKHLRAEREFVHLRKWGTNILLTVDDYEWVYSLRPWEKSRMKMSSNSPVSYVCFKQEESLTISSAMTKDMALLWSDFFARARDLS